MTKSLINFREAILKIHSALVAENIKGTELDELQAAVSHWLMNGQTKVPFLNQQQQKAASEMLTTLSRELESSDRVREKVD